MIRHGKETEVFWAEGNGPPDLVYGGEREKVRAPLSLPCHLPTLPCPPSHL